VELGRPLTFIRCCKYTPLVTLTLSLISRIKKLVLNRIGKLSLTIRQAWENCLVTHPATISSTWTEGVSGRMLRTDVPYLLVYFLGTCHGVNPP